MAQSLREVMSTDPVTLSVTTTAQDAAQTMREAGIGDVIVLDESDSLCGIVTDRDLALRLVAEGKSTDTPIGDLCTRDPVTLAPDDSVGDAVKMMSEKAIRRLPIIENGRPVGVVSLGDLAVTQDPESALADISAAPPNNE